MAPVSGQVTVELHKGRATSIRSLSPNSLYDENLASFTMGVGFEPAHSEGFVRLFGLPGSVARSLAQEASS